jgi:hypothetical protein
MSGPLWMVRTHDLRDWAQRRDQWYDYLDHRKPMLIDAWWQLHCRLVLDGKWSSLFACASLFRSGAVREGKPKPCSLLVQRLAACGSARDATISKLQRLLLPNVDIRQVPNKQLQNPRPRHSASTQDALRLKSRRSAAKDARPAAERPGLRAFAACLLVTSDLPAAKVAKFGWLPDVLRTPLAPTNCAI